MPSGFKNLNQFNRELTIFAKQTIPQEHLKLQKRIALDLLSRIVFRTPVRTGRARGNWQVELGGAGNSAIDRKDKAGSSTVAAGAGVIAGARPFGLITVFNNVDYIKFLEGGSSIQAPAGMVDISLVEVEAQFS
jgi:hypothetical protein